MPEQQSGGLGKILAWICHRCPVCQYGREHPDSPIGKILHHPVHADHCPMWKAERTVYGPGSEEDSGARQ